MPKKLSLLSFLFAALSTLAPLFGASSIASTGYQAFRELSFPLHESEFYRLAKEGQVPKTLVISCSDSRVIPELITMAGPGDIFVIRTAGNFVPNYTTQEGWDGVAATIEYAVKVLGIKEIIVCGHSKCGAIEALFTDPAKLKADLPLVAGWIRLGRQAWEITMKTAPADMSQADKLVMCEHISVVSQLAHLMTYPFIKDKVASKELYLHGWYFNIASGAIEYYNPAVGQFEQLK